MKIEMGKRYKNADGEVTIVGVDLPLSGNDSVAYIDNNGDMETCAADGKYITGEYSTLDLVEIKEPRVFWVSINKKGQPFGPLWDSYEAAKYYSKNPPIKVIEEL